jgi:hypothetical protein
MYFHILSKLSSSSSSRPLQDVVTCKICLGELPSGFGTCPLQLQVHKPHGFADLSWNFVTKCCKFPVKQLLSALPTRTNSSASTKKNVITLLSGTAFFNQMHISSSSSSSPFLTQESSAREGLGALAQILILNPPLLNSSSRRYRANGLPPKRTISLVA